MFEVNLWRGETSLPPKDEFHGELNNSQFISYSSLCSTLGVTAGVLHNEGSGWLRFTLEEKELIVAKKSIRHSISWLQLNSAGVVTGSKIITIHGKQYRVRLLRGADSNPTSVSPGYYVNGTHNSEWSKLFYPLVTGDSNLPVEIRNPAAPYTNTDLGIISGNGGGTWCRETNSSITNGRTWRGMYSVTYIGRQDYTFSNIGFGWRPCLELIP